MKPGAKGIAAQASSEAMKITSGASMNRCLSASAGMMSSLPRIFTISATGCSTPWKRPTRMGP